MLTFYIVTDLNLLGISGHIGSMCPPPPKMEDVHLFLFQGFPYTVTLKVGQLIANIVVMEEPHYTCPGISFWVKQGETR